MSNLELLDRAAGSAMCDVLAASGYALVGTGAVGIVAGGVGFVPFTAGALSLLAANYLCPEMPMGGGGPQIGTDGCTLVDGYGTMQVFFEGRWIDAFPPGNLNYDEGKTAVEIVKVEYYQANDLKWYSNVQWRITNGSTVGDTQYKSDDEQTAKSFVWRINPTNGTCGRESNDPLPLPPEAGDTYNYTDNITNCNYTVKLVGFAQPAPGGPVNPVLQIGGATTRSDGGRMGGCNFPDVIYMPGPGNDGGNDGGGGEGGGGGGGGGGDGPIIVPVPPDGGGPGPGGGIPWWAGPLLGGATSAGLGLIGDSINDLLQPTLPEGSYTLQAPCDVDEEGNALTQTWTYPEQKVDERLIAHQITMLEALQTHLNWKTPTCESEPTIPEGDFRTISFRSDETSPYGKSRLRKRFRYRSVSGNDLGTVVDHWKDFTFEGGPYRVRWIGRSWRSPEIWAATESEGQRVIQHAAAEAGFGALENGRWSTRLTSSARCGVPGTMRVDTTKGFYWITARDGSSERPIVAKT